MRKEAQVFVFGPESKEFLKLEQGTNFQSKI